MKIAIIDYGSGNVQSVLFALNRLGYAGEVTFNWDIISKADKVIFPGVGEASSAMKMLQNLGLDKLIPTLRQPVLGICLGMQLLCKHSEEGNTNGLGIFDVNVVRFSNAVKVPQMGWNTIKKLSTDLFKEIKEEEFMYLVHSFFVPKCKYTIATTEYDIEYAIAIQKDNFYGVQFHPEKSGIQGEKILKNFLELNNI
ncbi:imidazole glycerol phosphate synthase subunit HisH [Flavobacterium chuncheonense]|uniref:Imidazole glycerol phosphate synthase subunit HisH n=1 Tax=Flavobacterium chuncheonense TaxID=2026653 RepID=A0ABW5YIS6_9FLAO